MNKHTTPIGTTDKQKGFTIIELLLALAVFSFVLVFITTAFIQIFRTYTRGITRKDVNQSARLLLDDMTNKLRTVDSAALIDTTQINRGRLCFGGYSYVWNPVKRPPTWTNNLVNGQVVNLVRIDGDTGAVACSAATNITVGTATSMLSDKVGVQIVTINAVGGLANLFRVNITASTLQTDLLDTLNKCDPSKVGSQYCSQVSLTATVGLRNK